jgi:hypothetical protein
MWFVPTKTIIANFYLTGNILSLYYKNQLVGAV